MHKHILYFFPRLRAPAACGLNCTGSSSRLYHTITEQTDAAVYTHLDRGKIPPGGVPVRGQSQLDISRTHVLEKLAAFFLAEVTIRSRTDHVAYEILLLFYRRTFISVVFRL